VNVAKLVCDVLRCAVHKAAVREHLVRVKILVYVRAIYLTKLL